MEAYQTKNEDGEKRQQDPRRESHVKTPQIDVKCVQRI
jgi:hypothetical protein